MVGSLSQCAHHPNHQCLSQLLTLLQELQSQFPNQVQLDYLYAFTVPEQLVSECAQAIEGWQARNNRNVEGFEQHCQLNIVRHRLPPHQVQL